MLLPIENCRFAFAFQCPRTWDALRPTDDPQVRFCEACLKPVYLCDSQDAVSRRAAAGDCVAYYNEEDFCTLGALVPLDDVTDITPPE